MKQGDWQTVLSLREDDKHIVVMHVGDEDLISGVSVLGRTPENAFFINLVRRLTPEAMAIIVESLKLSNQPNLF